MDLPEGKLPIGSGDPEKRALVLALQNVAPDALERAEQIAESAEDYRRRFGGTPMPERTFIGPDGGIYERGRFGLNGPDVSRPNPLGKAFSRVSNRLWEAEVEQARRDGDAGRLAQLIGPEVMSSVTGFGAAPLLVTGRGASGRRAVDPQLRQRPQANWQKLDQEARSMLSLVPSSRLRDSITDVLDKFIVLPKDGKAADVQKRGGVIEARADLHRIIRNDGKDPKNTGPVRGNVGEQMIMDDGTMVQWRKNSRTVSDATIEIQVIIRPRTNREQILEIRYVE